MRKVSALFVALVFILSLSSSVCAYSGRYVGSINSKVLHKQTCHYVKSILSSNRVYFDSVVDAVKEGWYESCEYCKPLAEYVNRNSTEYLVGFYIGWDDGYETGKNDGYEAGEDAGYRKGVSAGKKIANDSKESDKTNNNDSDSDDIASVSIFSHWIILIYALFALLLSIVRISLFDTDPRVAVSDTKKKARFTDILKFAIFFVFFAGFLYVPCLIAVSLSYWLASALFGNLSPFTHLIINWPSYLLLWSIKREAKNQDEKHLTQLHSLNGELARSKEQIEELAQYQKKYENILAHEERLRRQINISTLGALNKGTVLNILPDGVTLMPSCIPVKGHIDDEHPYGEYTVYLSRSSNVYHRRHGCCGARVPVHYFRLNTSYSRCPICASEDPSEKTLPEWYVEIKRKTEENSKDLDRASDQETYYLMEARNGLMVRVPESKLEAWEEAQSKPIPPPTESELRRIDALVERVYRKNTPSSLISDESKPKPETPQLTESEQKLRDHILKRFYGDHSGGDG